MRIDPIDGQWWLDDGKDSGVWPCQVLSQNLFGVQVRQTNRGGPYYGETITVAHNRVYDSGFNSVRDAIKAGEKLERELRLDEERIAAEMEWAEVRGISAPEF